MAEQVDEMAMYVLSSKLAAHKPAIISRYIVLRSSRKIQYKWAYGVMIT